MIIYLLMGCARPVAGQGSAVADFSPYMASQSKSSAALQSDDLFIDIQQNSAAAAPLDGAAVLHAGFSETASQPRDRSSSSPSDRQHKAAHQEGGGVP